MKSDPEAAGSNIPPKVRFSCCVHCVDTGVEPREWRIWNLLELYNFRWKKKPTINREKWILFEKSICEVNIYTIRSSWGSHISQSPGSRLYVCWNIDSFLLSIKSRNKLRFSIWKRWKEIWAKRFSLIDSRSHCLFPGTLKEILSMKESVSFGSFKEIFITYHLFEVKICVVAWKGFSNLLSNLFSNICKEMKPMATQYFEISLMKTWFIDANNSVASLICL